MITPHQTYQNKFDENLIEIISLPKGYKGTEMVEFLYQNGLKKGNKCSQTLHEFKNNLDAGYWIMV